MSCLLLVEPLVPDILSDQVQAVFLALVAPMLGDDGKHAQSDENAEQHHGCLDGKIGANKQLIDAKHGENREILVEVLYGN